MSVATEAPSAWSDQSLKTLFDEHWAGFLITARRYLNCRSLAEDAVQQAFTIASKEIRGGKNPPRNPLPWLGAIVKNEAIRMSRKRQRELPVDPVSLMASSPCSSPLSPEEVVVRDFDNQRLEVDLRTAMSSLSTIERDIFYERFVREVPVADLSQRFGITNSTVRVHIHNARIKLRRWTRDHENILRAICFVIMSVGGVIALGIGATRGTPVPVAMAAAGGFFSKEKGEPTTRFLRKSRRDESRL